MPKEIIMGQIATFLENYTCGISHFETSRDYISISHCALSIEEIVRQQRSGFDDTPGIRLRCYKGYQMEADLKQRIMFAFPAEYSQGGEVSAFDGRVKGHPDFRFNGFPGDCKSVPLDEHLPQGRVPRKVFYQMQGYMLYLDKNRALVIYESRETGKLIDFWLVAVPSVQEEIHTKFQMVLRELKAIELCQKK